MIKIKDFGNEYLSHQLFVIPVDNLDVNPIPIMFSATSRDRSGAYVESDELEIIHEENMRYACSYRPVDISDVVLSIVREYSGEIDEGVLEDSILECYRKCDSTYGAGVRNRSDWGCDATIIIANSDKVNEAIDLIRSVGRAYDANDIKNYSVSEYLYHKSN